MNSSSASRPSAAQGAAPGIERLFRARSPSCHIMETKAPCPETRIAKFMESARKCLLFRAMRGKMWFKRESNGPSARVGSLFESRLTRPRTRMVQKRIKKTCRACGRFKKLYLGRAARAAGPKNFHLNHPRPWEVQKTFVWTIRTRGVSRNLLERPSARESCPKNSALLRSRPTNLRAICHKVRETELTGFTG